MSRRNEKVHVAKVRRAHVTGSGEKRCYESVYLRRTFRQGGKVCNETVANLSMLPAETTPQRPFPLGCVEVANPARVRPLPYPPQPTRLLRA